MCGQFEPVFNAVVEAVGTRHLHLDRIAFPQAFFKSYLLLGDGPFLYMPIDPQVAEFVELYVICQCIEGFEMAEFRPQ